MQYISPVVIKPILPHLYPCINTIVSITKTAFWGQVWRTSVNSSFIELVFLEAQWFWYVKECQFYLQRSWIGSWCQISVASSRGHCHLFYIWYNLYPFIKTPCNTWRVILIYFYVKCNHACFASSATLLSTATSSCPLLQTMGWLAYLYTSFISVTFYRLIHLGYIV